VASAGFRGKRKEKGKKRGGGRSGTDLQGSFLLELPLFIVPDSHGVVPKERKKREKKGGSSARRLIATCISAS